MTSTDQQNPPEVLDLYDVTPPRTNTRTARRMIL